VQRLRRQRPLRAPAAKLSLVLADAATAAVFARAPPPLVLTDAATAAVFAPAPLPLVLAQGRSLAGLLGCRRMPELWPGPMLWLSLRSSCLRRFPCGPSTILFLPAAAASGQSVRSNILLCGVFSMCLSQVCCFPLSRGAPVSMFCLARPLRFCKRRLYY